MLIVVKDLFEFFFIEKKNNKAYYQVGEIFPVNLLVLFDLILLQVQLNVDSFLFLSKTKFCSEYMSSLFFCFITHK